MKVLVVYGGDSPEHDVSVRSGMAVMRAGEKAGHDVSGFEFDGTESEALVSAIKSVDVVLPILHGKGGEDGYIQSILEKHSVKYLGSDPLSSKNCFDKEITRRTLKQNGILVPEGGLLSYDEYMASEISGHKHVLKPVDGGSTIDTVIVRDIAIYSPESSKPLFDKHQKLLVEELIEGVEITVAVVDGLEGKLIPIEIIPPEGAEFDYDNKYNGKTQEICPPINVSHDDQERAMELSEKVHQIMGCRHLSRTDIILTPSGEMYVLEINTIPGLTDQSLVPGTAKTAGYEMPDLVDHFIKLANSSH